RPRGDVRIVDQLHKLRTTGAMRAEAFDVISERGRAQREDDIATGAKPYERLAHRGQEDGEQSMVLWETAPARHWRHPHGCVVPLGETHDFVPRAVAVHGGTNHERWTRRVVERIADRGEHARVDQ